jgi:hypothetical protein
LIKARDPEVCDGLFRPMTSPVEDITIRCPQCGTVYEDWYRPSINFGLDPGLADPEYVDAASSATCPNPECKYRIDLGSLVVDRDTWSFGEGATRCALPPFGLAIACADIGSVAGGKFGWAASVEGEQPSEEASRPEELARFVASELMSGRSVALGFECPLYVPVSDDPDDLGRARNNEGNRPWSAGAGSGALATGLVQVAWVLRRVRELWAHGQLCFAWQELDAASCGLFIWEAFVSAGAKRPGEPSPHTADARLAIRAFQRSLDTGWLVSALDGPSPLSLVGAAALWSGWTTNVAALHAAALVIKATKEDWPLSPGAEESN